MCRKDSSSSSSGGGGSVLGKLQLMLGVLGNEGCRYFTQADLDAMTSSSSRDAPQNDVTDDDDARWRRTLRTYVRNNFRFHQQTIYDIVDHNYRDWEAEETRATSGGGGGDEQRRAGELNRQRRRRQRLASLVELITDGQFVAPTVDLAARHAACGPSPADTFLYSFGLAPDTDCGGAPRQPDGQRRLAPHPDLLAYVFGASLARGLDPFPPTVSDEIADERRIAETVMSYWANFIRTGFDVVCVFFLVL